PLTAWSFVSSRSGALRPLHSFPTRRSSDLRKAGSFSWTWLELARLSCGIASKRWRDSVGRKKGEDSRSFLPSPQCLVSLPRNRSRGECVACIFVAGRRDGQIGRAPGRGRG